MLVRAWAWQRRSILEHMEEIGKVCADLVAHTTVSQYSITSHCVPVTQRTARVVCPGEEEDQEPLTASSGRQVASPPTHCDIHLLAPDATDLLHRRPMGKVNDHKFHGASHG